MPYRHANYWVALTIGVIVWGFWGSYFNPPGSIPAAFHVHALTSLAWLGLLMLQIWSIQNGRRELHRFAGKLSFALFPMLIVGFVMIVNVSAAGALDPDDRGGQFFAASFGFSMAIAIAAYLTVYFLALKHRNNVALHAGYMLTTPLILFESPLSRVILDVIPLGAITGSDFPQLVLDAIVLSMLLSVVFAVVVYLRVKKYGAPFLVAAGFLVVESITMYFGPQLDWAREAFLAYARLPTWTTLVAGFLMGAMAAWLGWRATGKRVAARQAHAQ